MSDQPQYPPYQPPYQPPAYGAPFAPVHQARVKSPTGLATAALILGGLWLLVQVGCVVTVWPAVSEYSRASALGIDAANVWTAYDTVNVFLLPFMVATYILGCIWLFSARKAAEAINPSVPHSRSRVWVWLGWWVPVVSLWFPYQVVRDVRRGSTLRDSGVVGAWWALWLTSLVLSGVIQGLTPLSGLPSDGQLDALAWTEGLYTLTMLAAFGLWARIVWEVREAQRAILG